MPPTLILDDRQRAMLREMGVQVWQPRAAPPAPVEMAEPAETTEVPETAQPAAVAPAHVPPSAPVHAPGPVAATDSAPVSRRPAVPEPVPAGAAAPASAAPAAVLRGDWLAMFAPEGDDPQTPIWLVLADSPGADPREGDTGRLLQAMLKAAGLHRGARVWVAGVGRAGDEGLPLAEGLRQALAAHQPAMVLTLGRLSSQAALGSSEALGKLRGAVHSIGHVDPVPLVASYEPGWLLRSQDDKARAWEDLCRALAAVRGTAISNP